MIWLEETNVQNQNKSVGVIIFSFIITMSFIVLPGASQPLDEPSLYQEFITENYKYPRNEFTVSCNQSLFILGRQHIFF